MKITDSDSIKDGELELIDALTGDLDWGVIEQILKEKHKLGLHDEVVYNSGDLVVHNDNIAYRLDFDVKVKLSVLINRKGECLSLSTSSDIVEDSNELDDSENLSKDTNLEKEQSDLEEYVLDDPDQEPSPDLDKILDTDIEVPIDEKDMDLDIEFDTDLDDEVISDEDVQLQEDELESIDQLTEDNDLSDQEKPFDPETEKALTEEIENLDDIVDNDNIDKENISQMASQIAEMISEINER